MTAVKESDFFASDHVFGIFYLFYLLVYFRDIVH